MKLFVSTRTTGLVGTSPNYCRRTTLFMPYKSLGPHEISTEGMVYEGPTIELFFYNDVGDNKSDCIFTPSVVYTERLLRMLGYEDITNEH